jgi:hypothetical protein
MPSSKRRYRHTPQERSTKPWRACAKDAWSNEGTLSNKGGPDCGVLGEVIEVGMKSVQKEKEKVRCLLNEYVVRSERCPVSKVGGSMSQAPPQPPRQEEGIHHYEVNVNDNEPAG